MIAEKKTLEITRNQMVGIIFFLPLLFLFFALVPVPVDAQECSALISCDDIYDSPREVYTCSGDDVLVKFEEVYCASGTCRWREEGTDTIPCGIENSCSLGKCVAGDPNPTDPTEPEPPVVEEDEKQTLRVFNNGTGTGTVTSSPSGINCGSTCTVTRENTNTWHLAASPASGSTFDGWSIGSTTYNSEPCLQEGGGKGGDACLEWTKVPTCGELSQCKITVPDDKTRTVTATFTATAPTIDGRLDAEPESDTVDAPFTFTAVRESGTATSTVTYTTPRCVTSTRATIWGLPYWSSSFSTQDSVSSGNKIFVCSYDSPTSTTVRHGARVTMNQGTAFRTVSASVLVGEEVIPTPTPTPTPTPEPSEPVISEVRVQVTPPWVARGGSTEVSWKIEPNTAGSTTVCSVEGGNVDPSISYQYSDEVDGRSVEAIDIQQATRFKVSCNNDADREISGSATVYILPSYSEF